MPPAARLLRAALCAALCAAAARALSCPAGEHRNTLYTYVLTASSARLSAGRAGARFATLALPLADVAPTLPYVINGHEGGLREGLLDSLSFVKDWARLSAAADSGRGLFAMPDFAKALQCERRGAARATGGCNATSVPSNALLMVHGSARAGVADIYGVAVAGGEARFKLRWVPRPDTVSEGACHRLQDMDSPHYHHVPGESAIIEPTNQPTTGWQPPTRPTTHRPRPAPQTARTRSRRRSSSCATRCARRARGSRCS